MSCPLDPLEGVLGINDIARREVVISGGERAKPRRRDVSLSALVCFRNQKPLFPQRSDNVEHRFSAEVLQRGGDGFRGSCSRKGIQNEYEERSCHAPLPSAKLFEDELVLFPMQNNVLASDEPQDYLPGDGTGEGVAMKHGKFTVPFVRSMTTVCLSVIRCSLPEYVTVSAFESMTIFVRCFGTNDL